MNSSLPKKKEPKSNKKEKAEVKSEAKTDTSKNSSSEPKYPKESNKNKSASQTSISHFSSVSTPQYREGWERIWGKSGNSNTNINTDRRNDIPGELSVDRDQLKSKDQQYLKKIIKDQLEEEDLDPNLIKEICELDFVLRFIFKNQ